MAEKRGMKALELWCRRVTEGYPGVKIENMTTSWRDGLAFCALIHHFRPDLIDFDRLDKRDIYKNNELAFRIAERQLGIPALLDAEDMVEYEVPDRLSILTYLSQFYQAFVSNQQGPASPSPRKHTSTTSDILSSGPKNPSSKVGPGRLETCWSCRRPVFLAERLVAGGKLRHRRCFTCKRCGHQLNLVGSYETEDGDFVCETCPDEEKNIQEVKSETVGTSRKDDYSLNVEEALDSLLQSRAHHVKTKFLNDLISDNPGGVAANSQTRDNVVMDEEMVFTAESGTCASKEQTLSDNMKKKLKKLRDIIYGDSVSIEESVDNIKKEVSLIIDKIIEEAIERVDKIDTENVSDFQTEEAIPEQVVISVSGEATEEPVQEEEEVAKEEQDYPEGLNPFGDEDEGEGDLKLRRPPIPAARKRPSRPVSYNKDGQKIIEAPVVHLNPFWSDGEPSSEDELNKPVPAPRTSLMPQDKSKFGSNTSLNSLSSSLSTSRRKKGPAPRPPTDRSCPKGTSSPNSTPSSIDSRSPVSPGRSHRKSKPAPPPPLRDSEANELLAEKKEKNNENKIKQNLTVPDKSICGKWKRKKGQAPSLPIPQRRRITPLPLSDLFRELEDLEVQQRELERQGVNIEQNIRLYEAEEAEGKDKSIEDGGKDVEGLILQLFEIVNQKNELFRRQAELMYLRRQQRLEEEHADLEYQIRCLMGRPERNKTDTDKAQEEELIKRLVEVVERRNEIIECLDMDRRREVEEDESIHHHLEVFAGKGTIEEQVKSSHKSTGTLLRLIKKKKSKKDKNKGGTGKEKRDADKDIDESVKEEIKHHKMKKKWFGKILVPRHREITCRTGMVCIPYPFYIKCLLNKVDAD